MGQSAPRAIEPAVAGGRACADGLGIIACAGVATLILYAALFLWLFPLTRFDPAEPRSAEPFVDHLGAHLPTTWLGHGVGMGLIFVLYIVAWRASHGVQTARVRWTVAGFAVAFCTLFVFVRPEMTVDIVDYAFRSRMIVDYGTSPLTNAPDDLPIADAWHSMLYWRDIPTPYGPLWLALGLGPYRVFGDSLLLNLYAFKIISACAVLGCLGVIYAATAHVHPQATASALILFGWNPLLLIELIGNGHNDSVMILFVLLALWAVVRDRWLVVFPALAAALLIKATAALFVPFVLVHALKLVIQRKNWRFVAVLSIGCLLGLALIVTMYGLFWAGPDTLRHISRAQLGAVINSPVAALLVLSKLSGLPLEARVVGIIVSASGIFVAAYLILLLALWKGHRTLLTASFDGIAAFLFIGANWFWPWYVSWLLAPAALLADRRRQLLAMLLSASGIAYYFAKSLGLTSVGFSWALLCMFGLPLATVGGWWLFGYWKSRGHRVRSLVFVDRVVGSRPRLL